MQISKEEYLKKYQLGLESAGLFTVKTRSFHYVSGKRRSVFKKKDRKRGMKMTKETVI